mmetsp:Transcript_26725/g.39526  ORF Transcript_26725/g.39526 Transcript_26725/m.39526 type:complete len:201 (+) Transcript_26725:58-660(+)
MLSLNDETTESMYIASQRQSLEQSRKQTVYQKEIHVKALYNMDQFENIKLTDIEKNVYLLAEDDAAERMNNSLSSINSKSPNPPKRLLQIFTVLTLIFISICAMFLRQFSIIGKVQSPVVRRNAHTPISSDSLIKLASPSYFLGNGPLVSNQIDPVNSEVDSGTQGLAIRNVDEDLPSDTFNNTTTELSVENHFIEHSAN